jgi:hypothetical protein
VISVPGAVARRPPAATGRRSGSKEIGENKHPSTSAGACFPDLFRSTPREARRDCPVARARLCWQKTRTLRPGHCQKASCDDDGLTLSGNRSRTLSRMYACDKNRFSTFQTRRVISIPGAVARRPPAASGRRSRSKEIGENKHPSTSPSACFSQSLSIHTAKGGATARSLGRDLLQKTRRPP